MNLCEQHDIAYETRWCPCCELQTLNDELHKKIKELNNDIDVLRTQ